MTEQNLLTLPCPHCQFPMSTEDFFCASCGKKLREKPLSTSIWKQIGIYLVSALFPPLGLWPGIKYLRQNDPKLKIIGWVAIALTIVSLIVSAVFVSQIMNMVNQQLNEQLQFVMP